MTETEKRPPGRPPKEGLKRTYDRTPSIRSDHADHLKHKKLSPYIDLGLEVAIAAIEQGQEAAIKAVNDYFLNLSNETRNQSNSICRSIPA